MKHIYNVLIAIFIVFIAIIPNTAKASHALGADITYESLGGNQYRITYTFYRDCGNGAIAAPTSVTVNITSASCGASVNNVTLVQTNGCLSGSGDATGSNVSDVCASQANSTTCNNGTTPGVQVYVYCATVTLPQACSDWVISYSECCRNSAITNISNADTYDLYVSANLNNSTSGITNNSPIFTTRPAKIFCAGTHYCYNHGAIDLDGDSLAFSLVAPQTASGTAITNYNGGLSSTLPMAVSNNDFSFDPLTGQICFTASQAQVDVITVQVDEYRKINGVTTLVGTTRRDLQFNIQPASFCSGTPPDVQVSNPVGGGVVNNSNSNTTLQMCPNNTITFDVVSGTTSPDTLHLSSNATTSIPGSSFNITGNGTDTVRGSFSWTPTVADSGIHFFTYTVSNGACPVPLSTQRTITILVYPRVSISSTATAVCGDSIQLEAIGGSTFTWTPATGLSCTNCANPKAKPSVPTTYKVTSDCGADSITINIGTPFTLNAGRDTSICLNGAVQLNATTTGGGTGTTFNYAWSPSAPASIISNPAVANPIVSPTATTNFALHVESSQGCVKDDTVKVTISGVAPSVTALADPDTVCPGGTTNLTLTIAPTSCGASSSPCTNNTDYTVGTATTFLNSTTGFPCVFGNWYGGAKHQILYRASELNAMGITGGTINKIAFNIAQINGTTNYCDFTIRMKCVSNTSLTTWITSGLTYTYGPSSVSITTGWNTFTLNTPYDWDGVSNLLVDICFNNDSLNGPCLSTGYTQNSPNYYTATSYTSVVYNRADVVGDFCQSIYNSGTPFTSSNRPNTRFSVCKPVLSPTAIVSWTPSANVANPTTSSTTAQVFQNTTYVASVSQNGCQGSGFVNVAINNSLSLAAGPDTSICIPDSITLIAVATGTPAPISLTCGANNTQCGGPPVQYTIGSASGISSYITPFNGAEHEAHMQMLFRASELSAMGISRGIIENIGFNITNKASTGPFPQFRIKMSCTNRDTLTSGFITGLTTVYGPTDVTTTAGWNSFTLAAPYDWDGVSNIIVDVCFTNTTAVNADIDNVTSTGYSSTLYAAQSYLYQGGCNIQTGTLSNLRPDTRFNICPPPAGTFHYTWTPILGTGPVLTGDTIKVLATADLDYQVQVTDSSCYAYDTVHIHFLNGYSANLVGHNIGCNGSNSGDISAAPTLGTAPYRFIWKDSSGTTLRITNSSVTDTITNLAPGTYKVLLTDANGCQATDSFTVTVPPALTIDAMPGVNILCNGASTGSVSSTVSGGTSPYTYLWSTGDIGTSITNQPAGTYTLVVTDNSGCTVTGSTTLTQPAPIVLNTTSTAALCNGSSDGTATVAVTSGGNGNFTYLWSTGGTTTTITGLAAGAYTVTVTDVAGGCTVSGSTTVTQPAAYVVTVTNEVDASCYNTSDGQATASVANDTLSYTFLWDDGEPFAYASALSRGTHTVTATNGAGCTATASVTIGSPAEFIIATALVDSIQCYGDNNGKARVYVTSSGGFPPYSYMWSNLQSSDTVGFLSADSLYSVTVTDSHNCPEYGSITLTQPAQLHASATSAPATCFGGSDGTATATATGGTPPYTYLWSTGATTATIDSLGQGSYFVTVTDAHGCSDPVFNITVTQPANPVKIKSLNVVNVSCPGANDGAIFAEAKGGVPPYQFSLNGSALQDNGYFNPLSPDSNYVLRIVDSSSCEFDTMHIVVTQPESFTVEFNPATDTIVIGDSVLLQPEITPLGSSDSYLWSPSATLACDTCDSTLAKPVTTTVYELTVSRPNVGTNECSETARIEVVVINNKILYVPNAFSPNDDETNDFFQVYAPGGKRLKMKIFDRWGELMFAYDGDMTGKWDGKYKGDILPTGVFVYYIEVTYLDNQVRTSKGSVTIIK